MSARRLLLGAMLTHVLGDYLNVSVFREDETPPIMTIEGRSLLHDHK